MVERIDVNNRASPSTLHFRINRHKIEDLIRLSKEFSESKPKNISQLVAGANIGINCENRAEIAELITNIRETFKGLKQSSRKLVKEIRNIDNNVSKSNGQSDNQVDSIIEGVNNFISYFNKTIVHTHSHYTSQDLKQLGDNLTNYSYSGYENDALRKIGIEIGVEGKLSINELVMENKMQEFITNWDEETKEGLDSLETMVNNVERIVEKALDYPPIKYTDKLEVQEQIMDLADYQIFNNTGQSVYPIPINSGILLDFVL
ncbi:hypothetical protein [Natranaerobius thermophilus]|uniref:Uncharacterized protein n=1 Tax=Natranaerobius thermophilus (strain ATCC BAA-1301 / DSM 18059 / JW/NM-WN-LF) TaxID=457570 RepID=B2A8B1_NATTJ|nr:hypothetical protein [Natranaerobius thermophilus]ACB84477.1 hypothetical protein Nther_0892 [Natranaerobius thermophilus JW/NM-WN-LF]